MSPNMCLGVRLRRTLPFALLALSLTMLAGCPDKAAGPPPSGKETFGIQVVNGSSVPITVRVDGPRFAQTSVSLNTGGFEPVEVDAAAGDAISFSVDAPGAPTASGGCNAGADAVAGYPGIYAQVTIADPIVSGGPMQIICSSGWR